MLLQHELRVRLSERRDRLYKAASGPFENELQLFMAWLDGTPFLHSMLTELRAGEPVLASLMKQGAITVHGLPFPADESMRAHLCLEVCERAASGERGALRQWAHVAKRENHFTDQNRGFVEVIVDPLTNFLHDRLDEGGSVLGILERYTRRTEWFHQRELFDGYIANTARGEDSLDAHLREYLVDQGIANPFSQPRSPSGEADIVAGLGTDDPLVLEVKLFLPSASKGDAYIRQGFSQTIHYANDFNVPVGYLVVFNLTPELLVFETDAASWPPSVRIGEKTAFLIAIHTNPDRPSASRDRKLARHVITEQYLTAAE
jgi:hypothetical protein